MDYSVKIDEFEGPLDLLLHLVKISDIDIFDISIEEITKQYLKYITEMEKLNLNIASEYLVMAAELIEIKSSILLPKNKIENEDEYEEDPREKLINKLLDYQKYKEINEIFKDLESSRKEIYTKSPSDLKDFVTATPTISDDVSLDDLINAFNNFLSRKQLEKPLNTKITKKEYSVSVRNNEIRSILKQKKKVNFEELFDVMTKEYVVVTFLSILDLARKQEIEIAQENNFNKIILKLRGVDNEL